MAKKPAKKPAKRKAVKRSPKKLPVDAQHEANDLTKVVMLKGPSYYFNPTMPGDIEERLKANAKRIESITVEKNTGIVEPPPEPTPYTYTATYKLGREEPFIDETQDEHEHRVARAGLILAVAAFIIAMGLLWSFFS